MRSFRSIVAGLFITACFLDTPAAAQSSDADDLPARAVQRFGSTRFRHGSRILALAYSPSGELLAAGGGHDPVRLWDLASGKASVQLNDPWVQAMAFVAGGKALVTAGLLRSVHLWDTESGKELARLESHNAAVKGLALSSDGNILVTGDAQGQIHLWDMRSRRVVHKIAGHEDEVAALLLSPDANLLISAGSDRKIQVWDLDDDYKKLRTLDAGCAVAALSLDPTGKILFSAGDDGMIRRWQLATGKLMSSWHAHEASIVSLVLSRDGAMLISGAQDGSLRIWSAATGDSLRSLQRDPADSDALALAPDAKSLASAGRNHIIRLFDVGSGTEIQASDGPTAPLTALALAPRQHRLFTAAAGRIYQWDTKTAALQRSWQVGTGDAVLAVAPDGKSLAAGTADIGLWDVETGQRQADLVARKEDAALSAAYAPDATAVAVGWRSRHIDIVSLADSKVVHTLSHPAPVYAVRFSPRGDVLAAAGGNKIVLYDPRSGRHIKGLDVRDAPAAAQPLVAALAFAPDGRTLAVGCYDGVIYLLDVASGKEVRACAGHVSVPYAVAFSRDGRVLASASFDGTVRLWETFSGAAILSLTGHQGPVHGVALGDDDRTIYSAGADTTALAWDVTSRAGAVAPLTVKEMEPTWIELASEDTTLAHKAAWRFITAGPDAVAFLTKKVYLLDPDVVRQLFKDLNSENYSVRAVAMKRLHEYGRWMEGRLQSSLVSPPSLEARRRSEQLLKELNVPGALSLNQERLRMRRLMFILEHVAGAPSLALFRNLAAKAPEEDLQEEAKASLQRMNK